MLIPRRSTSKLAGLILLLLVWPAAGQAQDKHIDVTVKTVGGVSKLIFTNSECPGRPNELGCIQPDFGTSPNLSWELDHDSAQEWMLSGLQFSPDGTHWGDPQYPLADCTMQDFALDPEDRESGSASTVRPAANGQKLMIKNKNVNRCQTHYSLSARHRDRDQVIDSDPVIDNTGGGRP
jgi:hypothetical protein